MDDRTIDGELVTPHHYVDPNQLTAVREYVKLRQLLDAMPPGYVAHLAKAYKKGRRNRAYAHAADRAADVAYAEGLVDDDDQVIGLADETLADLTALGGDAGHPLLGYALDVAFAVLAGDQLDPDDRELITGWWRAAGAPLPGQITRRAPAPAPAPPPPPQPRARPVRGTAPVPRAAPAPMAAGYDPVDLAVADLHERKKRAHRLRQRAGLLWLAEFPLFLVCTVLAGYFVSWVPLLVAFLLGVALGVFAATTGAKANRQ